jgi:hypothetical protein
MTLVFDLTMKNTATASKDRIGMAINKWCNSAEEISVDELSASLGLICYI